MDSLFGEPETRHYPSKDMEVDHYGGSGVTYWANSSCSSQFRFQNIPADMKYLRKRRFYRLMNFRTKLCKQFTYESFIAIRGGHPISNPSHMPP
ncbi:hypothetical protein TNCV_1252821 [Trichonephila clavipes]|nr:hypothetical protein TNCV_1252821 [Trichonephila clavipes]